MSRILYTRQGERTILTNAYIVCLYEYDDNGRYNPCVEQAVLGYDGPPPPEVNEIIIKACILSAMQPVAENVSDSLDLEDDKGVRTHLSFSCVIVEDDKISTIGLAGEKLKCGLIISSIETIMQIPPHPLTQALLRHHHKITEYDKLSFALKMIMEGEALIYAEDEKELKLLQDAHLIRRSIIPENITAFSKYFKVVEGFIQPVRRHEVWDHIYSSRDLLKMLANLKEKRTLRLSTLAQFGMQNQFKKKQDEIPM